MKNENFSISNHSKICRHNEEDLLLYAYVNLIENKMFLISANEMAVFDNYLEFAKNNDKDIYIDCKSNDNAPYQLVYGGMMYHEKLDFETIQQCIMENKGNAMIDLDGEMGKVIASTYDDIRLYPDKEENNFVPFVALMKTHHKLHDEETSVSMFPYTGGIVWEDMVNKKFLFACRESVSIDNLSLDNWETFINEELLMNAFAVADLLIPKEES